MARTSTPDEKDEAAMTRPTKLTHACSFRPDPTGTRWSLRTAGRLPDFRTPEEEAEYWKLERERQKKLEEKEGTEPKRPTYNFEWNDDDWKQGLRPPTKALRRALREAGLDPDHFITSREAVKALRRQRYRPTPTVG
jgi:hypothetical protein